MSAIGVNGGPFAKDSILGRTTQRESLVSFCAFCSIASFPPRVSFRFAFDLLRNSPLENRAINHADPICLSACIMHTSYGCVFRSFRCYYLWCVYVICACINGALAGKVQSTQPSINQSIYLSVHVSIYLRIDLAPPSILNSLFFRSFYRPAPFFLWLLRLSV